MPLAEHIATDGLYFQHVNPQWERLLRVLDLSISTNAAREPNYSQRTADLFSIFFPGIASTTSATIIPPYWGPSSMNCKSVAQLCCRATFQNWQANWRSVFAERRWPTVRSIFCQLRQRRH